MSGGKGRAEAESHWSVPVRRVPERVVFLARIVPARRPKNVWIWKVARVVFCARSQSGAATYARESASRRPTMSTDTCLRVSNVRHSGSRRAHPSALPNRHHRVCGAGGAGYEEGGVADRLAEHDIYCGEHARGFIEYGEQLVELVVVVEFLRCMSAYRKLDDAKVSLRGSRLTL